MLNKLRKVLANLSANVSEIFRRIEDIESHQPKEGKKGEDGKDAEPVDINAIVDIVLAKIPKPEDGKDAEQVDVCSIINAVVSIIPTPENGKDADLSSFYTLMRSISLSGVSVQNVCVNSGEIKIDSDTATQEQVDAIVEQSKAGEFFSNQSQRILDVEIKTKSLSREPVSVTVPTGVGLFSIYGGEEKFAYYSSLVYSGNQNSAELPQYIPTLSGVLRFDTVADLVLLARTTRERQEYIYTRPVANQDGSFSELAIVSAILSAVDQVELDAIVDTRQ